MADSPDKKSYLDINELIARTGMSRATVWRLKDAGKIPFYQPGGKGCRVTFPEDAIERDEVRNSAQSKDDSSERLPGPQPNWMASSKSNQ